MPEVDIVPYILPAVVAGVAVFIASFLIWMVIKWHDRDISPLPDEPAFLDGLKAAKVPPGFYMWPMGENREVKSDAFKARWSAGPWGNMVLLPTAPNFARNLISTLIVYILISWAAAVVISPGIGESATYWHVFWPASLVAGAVYCLGPMPGSFFFGKASRFMLTDFIDGLIFAAVTAGVLAALWP